ncbi:hypothetical protein SDC9_153493 [bioreactor metagenome]|uniref:Uncharacterized protein n=1 Tax=bioreactor metagenome TaxID=1076179 RepID=A0A645EWI7_9ZZZZ
MIEICMIGQYSAIRFYALKQGAGDRALRTRARTEVGDEVERGFVRAIARAELSGIKPCVDKRL